jgi:aryl-alcohol dehydrogenase-like predicted oxidoreductase
MGAIQPDQAIDLRAERLRLGRFTAVEVSRLCLGLGSSPPPADDDGSAALHSSARGGNAIQARFEPSDVAGMLEAAFELGVTWWDTSDDYGTHAHVREALRRLPRERVQITTKTHAPTYSETLRSVRQSLAELGTDYVDVLLLHEVDSPQAFELRRSSLEALQGLKSAGKARAVGLSTHNIDVLERVAGDRSIDVILTNYNLAGVHMDASIEDYEAAMTAAARSGQGIVVMKTLGEGRLVERREECIRHNLTRPFVHGVVVGVKNSSEALEAADIWQKERRN